MRPALLALLLLADPRCPRADRHLALAEALQRISGAVAVTAQASPDLDGAQILAALREDPEVGPSLAQLAGGGRTVQALARGGQAVVLLCDVDGAVLEDSACTEKVDRDAPPRARAACEFTLDPAAACAR